MKTRFTLSTMLSVAALLTACNVEVEIPSEEISGELVTLEATIGEPGTKIHFAADRDTYTETRWEADDCIWVRSDTKPLWETGDCFRTTAADISSDGHSAKFTGRTRRDGKLCAVYPYQMVNALSGNDAVVLDVPDNQLIVPGDCPRYSNAAVAFWADGGTGFAMKYVFGALKLSLKGDGVQVSRFELIEANPSFALWGTCVVTPDYEAKDIKEIKMEGDAAVNKLSIVPPSEITLGDTPYEFYVILPEGALSRGFVLKALDASGKTVARIMTDKANSIVRGKVLRMPAVAMETVVPGAGVNFEGSGVEADPFIISTPEELIGLADYVNSEENYAAYADKVYRQTVSIDMSGKDYTPVGAYKARPFKGVYDAGGFTIANLSTSGLNKDNPASGIFGYAEKAVINGIMARGRSNTGAFNMVGGIVGSASECEITNCYLDSSDLSVKADYCGGIVGSAYKGSIENCIVTKSSVSGNEEVGGIAGKLNGTEVKQCAFMQGMVNSASDDVGGIAGWCVSSCTFDTCLVLDAEINAKTDYAGGIVGLLEASVIKGCTVNGTTKVSGEKNCIGGIAGYAKKTVASTLEACNVCGSTSVSGIQNIGGMIGWLDTGTLKDCILGENALVSGSGDGVGGMVGRAISKSGTDNLLDNCVMTGNAVVEGAYSVGGIIGYAYPDSKGPVNIINCGVHSGTIRSLSCDTGADPAQGDCMSAGIVGRMRLSDAGSIGRIINCYVYVSGLPCVLQMVHPSLGAFIGYGHISDTGEMLVYNCCTNLGKNDITLAGAVITDTSSASQVGALFGKLPNSSAVKVTHNVYMDNGLGVGVTGNDTVVSDNTMLDEGAFADGNTAQALLNANLSGSGFTLREWTVDDSGRPVIN
ncbi:MAG: hypothetical protein J6W82_08555 [Bacteroidales bacterium]|nr:hypothetical protein [Bacteroidales bacterium]